MTALHWLGLVDDGSLEPVDWIGGRLALLGSAVVASGWRAG